MALRIGSVSLTQDQRHPFEENSQQSVLQNADLLLVAGFRTGMRGMMLRASLDRIGLVYQTPIDTDPSEDALILGSRFPFLQHELPENLSSHYRECIHVSVGKINLIAYDLAQQRPQSALLEHLISQAETLKRDQTLFIGRGPEAVSSQASKAGEEPQTDGLAAELTRLGFIDAAQLHKPAPSGATLQSPFRASVTPALAPQLGECFLEESVTKGTLPNPGKAALRVG